MEDALVQTKKEKPYILNSVLILVLMEDALVLDHDTIINHIVSLNPCFNGRCTSTLTKKVKAKLSLLS